MDACEMLAAESADVGIGIIGVGKTWEPVPLPVLAPVFADADAIAEEAEERAPTGIGIRVGIESELEETVAATMGLPTFPALPSLPPLPIAALPGSGSLNPLHMNANVSNLLALSHSPSAVPSEWSKGRGCWTPEVSLQFLSEYKVSVA